MGRFTNDYKEYIIDSPTKRPFLNYLWNKGFQSVFSNTAQGDGFRQKNDEKRSEIISGRMIYLLCDDKVWTANGISYEEEIKDYEVRVGRGYSKLRTRFHQISTEWTAFVPENDTCEIWKFCVKNESSSKKTIRVLPFCGTRFDGQTKYQ